MKRWIDSAEDMHSYGRQLGRCLKGGEFIELVGDVGAGKTTLTKGIAEGMGISETIQSPTFTISRNYESPDGRRLAHYDFYRLPEAGIMNDELEEASRDPKTVVVVEWADAVRGVVPADHLRLSFATPSETTRDVSVTGSGQTSERVIEELRREAAA